MGGGARKGIVGTPGMDMDGIGGSVTFGMPGTAGINGNVTLGTAGMTTVGTGGSAAPGMAGTAGTVGTVTAGTVGTAGIGGTVTADTAGICGTVGTAGTVGFGTAGMAAAGAVASASRRAAWHVPLPWTSMSATTRAIAGRLEVEAIGGLVITAMAKA